MKTVVNWLQNLRSLKVFTVLLAVVFLFLVQACNLPGIAAQPPNSLRYDSTKDYPLSPYKGGMNNFSDVDPRAGVAAESAQKRADDLIKGAQSNLQRKSIDSPEQYVRNYQQGTPLGERVKRLGEDLGSSAQELQEGVTQGTQRGVENLKENLQKTVE